MQAIDIENIRVGTIPNESLASVTQASCRKREVGTEVEPIETLRLYQERTPLGTPPLFKDYLSR